MACADCKAYACHGADKDKLPKDCPGREEMMVRESLDISRQEPVLGLLQAAARVEAAGYCQLTRLEETMVFAQQMGFTHLGVAFCYGLRREASILIKILRDNGFIVTAAICKNGNIPKSKLGLGQEEQIRTNTSHETMCNPVGQALILNQAGSEFNIVVGLCVGHDAVFLKQAAAPSTVLIVKDRVLCHNPAGALYQAEGYYRARLQGKK